jgi:hypothetical protein
LAFELVGSLAALLLLGCRNQPSEQHSSSQAKPSQRVLLRGTFQAVTKPAQGTAEIIKRGEDYELQLSGVSVKSSGEVHVYLVGLPSAPSTAAVDAVDMKYDMASLTQGAAEQHIALPSEPDVALRSVVLWDPKYGANLASATLSTAN